MLAQKVKILAASTRMCMLEVSALSGRGVAFILRGKSEGNRGG